MVTLATCQTIIVHEHDTGRTGTGVPGRRRGEETKMTASSIVDIAWAGSCEKVEEKLG